MSKTATSTPGVAPEDLLSRLPQRWKGVVEQAKGVAERSAVAVCLVGGPVRDLLLGREGRDLDLVVEGDGLRFAEQLAAALGGEVGRTHPAFLTAEVALADGDSIDVASTRSETYAAPAALPTVRPAGLAEDLRRRDFTVNTVTLQIGPGEAAWIDPLGGEADLQAGLLRVLHPRSFWDDPTRVLRAVRLEARLGLLMEPQTEDLARRAVAEGAFEPLSGSRLRDELWRLFAEPEIVVASLARLAELGGLGALDGELRWGEEGARRLESVIEAWGELAGHTALAGRKPRIEPLLLAALLDPSGREVAERVAERLQVAGWARALLLGEGRRRARVVLASDPAPHAVVAALESLKAEDLLLLAAEDVGGLVRHYLDTLAGVRLRVTGEDLIAAGIEPGPALGAALERTRNARLDGEIGAEEELSFALRHASRAASR